MSDSTPARDWNELVADNKDTLFFIPTSLEDQAKAWQAKRVAFQKEANRLAEKENELTLMFTQLIYDARKYFADNGIQDVWTKDISFNTEALKEGKFVLGIMAGQRQP